MKPKNSTCVPFLSSSPLRLREIEQLPKLAALLYHRAEDGALPGGLGEEVERGREFDEAAHVENEDAVVVDDG